MPPKLLRVSFVSTIFSPSVSGFLSRSHIQDKILDTAVFTPTCPPPIASSLGHDSLILLANNIYAQITALQVKIPLITARLAISILTSTSSEQEFKDIPIHLQSVSDFQPLLKTA